MTPETIILAFVAGLVFGAVVLPLVGVVWRAIGRALP